MVISQNKVEFTINLIIIIEKGPIFAVVWVVMGRMSPACPYKTHNNRGMGSVWVVCLHSAHTRP